MVRSLLIKSAGVLRSRLGLDAAGRLLRAQAKALPKQRRAAPGPETSARRRSGIPRRISSYTTPGSEAGVPEGPYASTTANIGVKRLITSMRRAGIGPNENVHAELGSTWWYTMRYPVRPAHLLGKLLKYVGEDNV